MKVIWILPEVVVEVDGEGLVLPGHTHSCTEILRDLQETEGDVCYTAVRDEVQRRQELPISAVKHI